LVTAENSKKQLIAIVVIASYSQFLDQYLPFYRRKAHKVKLIGAVIKLMGLAQANIPIANL
jgi:hypothetical protein